MFTLCSEPNILSRTTIIRTQSTIPRIRYPKKKKQHLTFEEGSMISIWQHVYRMQIRMLLLFHSLANSISCFFFARTSSRTWYRTYINFILRWCFNAAPHSFSHSLSPSANVYFRGCVCIFFYAACLSLLSLILLQNLCYFDFFYLYFIHQFY